MPRVTLTVPDKMPQPYRFQLDRRVVTIGRGSENDIAVDCGSISVRHAEMVRIDGGYELRDLGSTNGIKLDDKRCEVIALRDGASVKLGDVAFDFQLADDEREALRREKVLDDAPAVNEPEAAPAAQEAAAEPETAPKKRPAAASDGGGGFMVFVLILLFALVAFFAGLAVRHYRETGGWLFNAIQSKTKTLRENRGTQGTAAPAADATAAEPATPAAPAPSAPAEPAPAVPAPAE